MADKQRSHTRPDRTRKQFWLPRPVHELLEQRMQCTGIRPGELMQRAFERYCNQYDQEQRAATDA